MSEKLYWVTVEYGMFVMADDERDAEYEGESAVRHGNVGYDGYASAREVTDAAYLSGEDLASVPANSDDDRTVAEILAGVPEDDPWGAPLVPAPVVPDKNQTSLDFGGDTYPPPNTGAAT